MNLLSDINIHLENKRASRVFFIFMWLMYAFVYMTKNCFSGALAAIVEEGTLTLTQATVINAAFYVAYAPLQILGGIFADKYSLSNLLNLRLVDSGRHDIGSGIQNLLLTDLRNDALCCIVDAGKHSGAYRRNDGQTKYQL
jgi:sugar phosphate permease